MPDLDVKEMTPGWLVTEIVSLQGGITYDREYEESYFDDKAQVREWKTTSRIANAEEREEAQKLRSRIYQLVRSKCVRTPVGLICEDDKKTDLTKALKTVKEERDLFNDRAQTCKIHTNHACFEVKADNHQTIAAIMDQIAGVAARVNSAITRDDETTLKTSARKWLKGMSPDAILLLPTAEKDAIVARARAEHIRKAIRDIKGVERLLPQDASQHTKAIVKESRLIARSLCNKVERHSQALTDVLDEVDLGGIRKTRMAFVLAAAKADKRALSDDEKVPLVDARKIVC